MQHNERVNDKVHEHYGQKIVELEARVAKAESDKKNAQREKKNKTISATIAKKQLAKLKEELNVPPKDPKRRH